MKVLRLGITVLLVGFWITMNGLLVRRQVDERHMGRHLREAASFLGDELRRERWLEIFRDREDEFRKLGYTGFVLEKSFTEPGVQYRASLETVVERVLPPVPFLPDALRDRDRLEIRGALELDGEMRPLGLELDIAIGFPGPEGKGLRRSFLITGERAEAGDRMLVTLRHGETELLRAPVPLEGLALSDGLAPAIPTADFRVGEKYEVRVFDPLSPLGLAGTPAEVRVAERRTEEVNGTLMDVYVLETSWRKATIRSLVTEDGEVVRQEVGPPLDLVLRHASSRERAVRGYER